MPRELIHAIGWTLVHFVWQGALVWFVLAAALRRVSEREAQRRYLLACGALLATAALPVATFFVVSGGDAVRVPSTIYDPSPGAYPPTVTLAASMEAAPPDSSGSLYQRGLGFIERWFPHLVLLWSAGVCAFGGRLLLGWLELQRLRFRYVRPVGESLRRRVEEIAASLGVHHPVWLLESAIAPVPAVVGWLRPAILLPASAMTGLSPRQLELVLAHELAHVRRHDYLVNFIQSTVEVLFFYHPAVWGISRIIRREREHACDDLAIDVMGDPLALGKALAALEKLRPAAPMPSPAVAATGGDLYRRVKRLVVPPMETGNNRTPLPALLAGALLLPSMLAIATPPPREAPRSVEPAVAAFNDLKRKVITVEMKGTTLGAALAEVTRQTGVRFVLPPGAAEQPVDFEFEGVSAGMVINSAFNLLQMDFPADPATQTVTGAWWDGCGPYPGVYRLSLHHFHERQRMFGQLKREVQWGRTTPIPLEQALGHVSEVTGLRFQYDAALAALPVPTCLETVTARGVINKIAHEHDLVYRYEDDSTITFIRPP
ncbi:MAG: M56 family metallopeptidase [Candidatus Sumerlaeia bacterium]|nr:M56 family metallopeptidase [Candidatus Sumerlaeia bacterium]